MAARLLEIEMRTSGFRMETEFYFIIFQRECSVQKYVFATRYVHCEINRILEGVGKGNLGFDPFHLNIVDEPQPSQRFERSSKEQVAFPSSQAYVGVRGSHFGGHNGYLYVMFAFKHEIVQPS